MKGISLKLIALLLLAVAGCSEPDSGGYTPDPTPTPTPDPPVTTPYFRATVNDIYLQGPDDTGFNFMVETNMADSEWTVETDATWLQVTKCSTGVTIVPSQYDPRREDNGDHAYPAPRSGSVSVKAGSLFSKTFTVIQESWTFISSEYGVTLKPSGESVDVSVRHNCYSWTASCDASWLTIKKKDSSTITITSAVRGADDTHQRSAVVRVQSDRDSQTFWNITVSDAESNLGNEDYNYGDHTDWD